ncbi:MAG: BrxE family protein [Kiritimatiellae bacterium]|nr:BrxE family protein [Kiritimatiellia bacterium]
MSESNNKRLDAEVFFAGEKHTKIHCQLAMLRMLVGYLGEKNQSNWWDCQFLSPYGIRFLEINFPRTILASAITSVTAAAMRFHDERIGKKDVFHLFRLPAGLEEAVHNALPPGNPAEWTALIHGVETAIKQLNNMHDSAVDASVGPVQVGTVGGLMGGDVISVIAKHYNDAFSNKKIVLPYFTGVPK